MHQRRIALIFVGCAFVLIVSVFVLAVVLEDQQSDRAPNLSKAPVQAQSLPESAPTGEPTPINLTPTPLVPTAIPTIVALQPPVLITGTLSTIETSANPDQVLGTPVNSTEPIHSLAWAPTGDKILYVTNSGKLYSANPDGANAALLDTYAADRAWMLLRDQVPLGRTLLIPRRNWGQTQALQELSVIQFTPDQPPNVERVPATGNIYQIQWWSAERAYGLVTGDYIGGNRLVVLDSKGSTIGEHSIPYMSSGAVQPGGDWLAYATEQQATNASLVGSDPQTIYLLNLTTGQRFQVMPSGKGVVVHSWSPDGRWFLVDAIVEGALQGVVISADAKQQFVVNASSGHGLATAAWNRAGNQFAFSIQLGGQEEPNSQVAPLTSQVYRVDLSKKQAIPIAGNVPVMLPSWSPDGSLALLSFDPKCSPWPCSSLNPAFYLR